MTWIKTVAFEEADERLKKLMMDVRSLYPIEYEGGVESAGDGEDEREGVVASHTLIPDAMYHMFAGFGVLMSTDLPLQRRQHEMIATVVSAVNACHY